MLCAINLVRKFGHTLLLALSTLGLAAVTSALAQTPAQYPDKPVKIIVPFPPGGAADTFARLAAQKLTDAWGKPVLVDNRPGAGGIIGTEATAKAAPDGYTFEMVTIGHAVNPFMYSKLPYDTQRDLTPVASVATVPSLVVTGPAFSGASLKDLLTQAKAKPNSVQFASSGIGSTSHVGAALLESMAGVDMLHVPYKGAAPALQDVMGGNVPMSVDIITSSIQQVKAGKLKALAITSAKRSAQLPDVPTVAEAGIPGYEFVAWYMLIAPAATPPAIIERVNADLRQISTQDDYRKRIESVGGEVMTMTVKELNGYLLNEFMRWGKVVKSKNIKAD